MDTLTKWITKHLKLELDVLRGERCRICYGPAYDLRTGLCGSEACLDEAALQEETRDLPACS